MEYRNITFNCNIIFYHLKVQVMYKQQFGKIPCLRLKLSNAELKLKYLFLNLKFLSGVISTVQLQFNKIGYCRFLLVEMMLLFVFQCFN